MTSVALDGSSREGFNRIWWRLSRLAWPPIHLLLCVVRSKAASAQQLWFGTFNPVCDSSAPKHTRQNDGCRVTHEPKLAPSCSYSRGSWSLPHHATPCHATPPRSLQKRRNGLTYFCKYQELLPLTTVLHGGRLGRFITTPLPLQNWGDCCFNNTIYFEPLGCFTTNVPKPHLSIPRSPPAVA